MITTTLQIPMQQQLRRTATKAAEKQGFSSLQEMIRVFLKHFAEDKVQVSFISEPVQLSPESDER